MNRNDVLKIVAMLEVNYPQHYSRLSKDQFSNQVTLWTELFKDDDANLIATVVKTIISTDSSPFPPNIGQIRSKAFDLTTVHGMTELEAWGYVDKALKNSGYHSKEEWAKLPHEVKMCVTPEQLKAWAQDENFNSSVESSNFQRSFRAREKARIEYERLPKETKALIQQQTPIQHKRVEQIVEYPKVEVTLTKEDEDEIAKQFAQLGEN